MRKLERAQQGSIYVQIGVDEIYAGRDGREADAALPFLAASITRHGLLQPVVVRLDEETGRYTLVCGRRRLQACRLAGLSQVDAHVLVCSEWEAAACRMEEHQAREAPDWLSEAEAIEHLDAQKVKTHLAMPERIIDKQIRMLGLTERVRGEIRTHALSFEQTQPLLHIRDEAMQLEALSIIAQRGLSGAQARRLVLGPERAARPQAARSAKRRAASVVMEAVSEAMERLRAKGMPIQLSMHAQENGISIQIILKKEGVNAAAAGKQEDGIE